MDHQDQEEMADSSEASLSGYNSPHPTHNPPPPPEFLENKAAMEDTIEDTAFSKEFVYTIFLKLIQALQEAEEKKEKGGKSQDEGKEHDSSSKGEEEQEEEVGVDMDEEMEEQLCHVWDCSSNSKVSKFLQEWKAVSILAKVVSMSRNPRLSEISVGILANMCCVPELCEEMSQDNALISLVNALLSNTEFDALTLKETMRLVSLCLSNKNVRDLWVKVISENQDVKQLMIYIFQSSKNEELLTVAAEVVSTLLDLSDALCEDWASADLVAAVIEAEKQIRRGHNGNRELGPFLNTLHLMSTTQSGVEGLVEHSESITQLLLRYLAMVCDSEIVEIDDHLFGLLAVISLVHLLFTNDTDVAEKLSSRPSVLQHVLKIVDALYRYSRHHNHTLHLPSLPHHHHHHHHHRKRRSLDNLQPNQTNERRSRRSYSVVEKDKTDSCQKNDCELKILTDSQAGKDSQSEADMTVPEEAGDNPDEAETSRVDQDLARKTDSMRDLFELLQNFLRDFVDSWKLDEEEETKKEEADSGEEAASSSPSNSPLFLPLLRSLNSAPHNHLLHFVSALALPLHAHNGCTPTPPPGGDAPYSHTHSAGVALVQRLCQLCLTFKLTRLHGILTDALDDLTK